MRSERLAQTVLQSQYSLSLSLVFSLVGLTRMQCHSCSKTLEGANFSEHDVKPYCKVRSEGRDTKEKKADKQVDVFRQELQTQGVRIWSEQSQFI